MIENKQRAGMTADGRYRCRYPGCNSTFATDGQCRRNQEAKHTPPVNIADESSTELFFEDDPKKADDMYNYQKQLIEFGMLRMNVRDAISEGDGSRVVRRWKFLLLYLKQHSAS